MLFLLSLSFDCGAVAGFKSRGPSRHTLPEPIKLPVLTKGENSVDTIRAIVLLAQFNNLKFKYPRDNFVNLLNKRGYSYSGASGSVSDYFYDQMGEKYPFRFDVGPVVTLDKGYAYYGENDSGGNDKRPAEMVAEVCRKSDSSVDFSLYDAIYVYYAGGNEADGSADKNHIWPHTWDLRDAGISLTLDGVRICSYACSSEIVSVNGDSESETDFATIGTFCHEFCHILGLQDMYDTNYETDGDAMELGYLSLMSYGNYLNDGKTPPNFTACERLQLGLVTPSSLVEGPRTLSVGEVLIRESGTVGEYYLLEYRKAALWDAYIGGSGLVIYHIDRSSAMKERWEDNEINAVRDHPCVKVMPPVYDMAYLYGKCRNWYEHPFWPYRTWNTFSASTDPSFSYWNGDVDDLSIKNITLGSSSVSFDVAGHIYLDSKEIFPDAAILSWTLEGCKGGDFTATLFKNGTQVASKSTDNLSQNSITTTFENLEPESEYSVKISIEGDACYSYSCEIETPTFAEIPYMVMGDLSTTLNGDFRSGQKLPLRIMPEKAVEGVEWTLDGSEISVSSDGYYSLEKSGLLKARVNYKDGSVGIFAKQLSVK